MQNNRCKAIGGKKYNVIDLFAGAGGLSLGFQQAKKYSIKVAFENNPAMQATYRKNHPDVDVRGDVCNADYAEIQKEYGPIDVVIGGPPCQGFSNANRQKNHMVSRNNSLVKEYIRAIRELRPKAFIMENVSMLRSDVHRFFLTKRDIDLIDNNTLEMKTTPILLLDSRYLFKGAINLVMNEQLIREYLWADEDYLELNVIYKASKSPRKLLATLKKHEKKITEIALKHIHANGDSVIQKSDKKAFNAILAYYRKCIELSEIKIQIEPAIMYQKMLSHALEIIVNKLVVDKVTNKNGLIAEIRSFAVFDYLKVLLESGEGKDGYALTSDILCAADFGAPQKRMRFIVIGIRKDITTEAKLPSGKFKGRSYRTVRDAIADLEKVEPVTDIVADVGIPMERISGLCELANSLRDSKILMNHIVTNTTDVAMRRFQVLKQGENFHALDDKLKTNTYTDVSRTQNTIYLRLDYDQPSGTVVNVRKSMWVHPVKNRAVSVREAARLQTFPDSFVFVGTKDGQYQQVGNAVPPIMAKAIAKELAVQLNRYTKK